MWEHDDELGDVNLELLETERKFGWASKSIREGAGNFFGVFVREHKEACQELNGKDSPKSDSQKKQPDS